MKNQYTLIFLALSIVLGLQLPAYAIPVGFDFSGTTGVGIVSGSFTYDNAEAPLATNVRGLAPNATYALINWNFGVTSNFPGLPSTTFANSIAGNSVEFCQGNCVFSSPGVTNLIFTNADNLLMQLTFGLLDPTPFTSPPADLSEWGSMSQSIYRVSCPVCVPLVIFQDGTLTATTVSIPEPSSLFLLALGLVSLGTWTWKQQGSRDTSASGSLGV